MKFFYRAAAALFKKMVSAARFFVPAAPADVKRS